MGNCLMAGAAAGVAGLLVFLTIHHFWISPIWFILIPGLLIAVLGGLAIGWSYAEIKPGLPARPWTAPAMIALVCGILAPAILLTQTRPPPLDVNTGAIINGTLPGVVARFTVELLLTATIVGGLAGWWIGRTPQAALATALAGFVFALGPGHNIPLLGNTPGAGKGIAVLLAVIAASSIVLVEVEALLSRSG